MASALNLRAADEQRSRLLTLIERHALLVFFALAYAISWTIWAVEPLLAAVDASSGRWFGLLAPYGPTVAALTLAGLLQPQQLPRDRSAARYAMAGAVLASSIVLLWPGLGAITRSSHPLLAATVWLLAALVPAAVVWSARSSLRGVRGLLSSLLRWRVGLVWYAAALLLMPLAALLGLALLALLGQPVPALPRTEPLAQLLPLLLSAFVGTLLYGGPLGEEPGWRGFALPRLQARFSPLVASLILGLLWGLWHLPLHLSGVYQGIFPDGLATALGLRLLTSVGLAILFTWLYNRTRGNLLLMALLHTAVNNTAGFWLPITLGTTVVTAALVAIVVSVDQMWLPARREV